MTLTIPLAAGVTTVNVSASPSGSLASIVPLADVSSVTFNTMLLAIGRSFIGEITIEHVTILELTTPSLTL